MTGTACPTCDGKRLKPEALGVTFAGHDIAELTHLSVAKMAEVLKPASTGQFDTEPVIPSAVKDLGASRRGDPSPSAQDDRAVRRPACHPERNEGSRRDACAPCQPP